jgi:hypothetical protein
MVGNRDAYRPLRQPAFIACVAVLGTGILGMSAIERAMGLVFSKQPLPLRTSLDQLAPEALAPYRVGERFTIEDPDLLRSLGTRDYIQWVLEDPRRRVSDPAREVLLFVTYYARPDRIPHVPEECYLGNGFQRLATDTVTLHIPVSGETRVVHARSLLFGPAHASLWARAAQVPVVYLFRVNDVYVSSREEARLALNRNLFGQASYFAKVELVFNRAAGTLSVAQAQAAAQDILSVVLPILEQDHWPTWPVDPNAPTGTVIRFPERSTDATTTKTT